MARPKKSRTICGVPKISSFNNGCNTKGTVELTVDEYEVVRQIDYLGLTQNECARQMQVARATIAAIYDTAKYKISDSMVNNKAVKIEGGDYEVCTGSKYCCGHCGQNRCGRCNHGKCDRCTGIFHERGRECYVLQYN